ncbi:AraC family transcriptional regulator N-terminal domain-containing protein [Sphingobacterium sp. KU25419]|jgi:AraC-like DNA-binding protein|nr:AraC family transcriptional regulator N-terminal domain-containing protein [Sphingobacterium sp. KU25419]
MINNRLVNSLPFSSRHELSTLVENRRAFTLENLELNVFETYQRSEKVALQFDDLVIINMIHGKKVMHLHQRDSFEYLPGETMILPAYSKMQIDFPEATFTAPTQCTALTISKAKIDEVINHLNEHYPKVNALTDWKLDLNLFHLYNTPELTDLINKLFQTITGDNPLKDALTDLTFRELIIRLLQTQSLLSLDIGKTKNNTALEHIRNYIHAHLSESITVEVLEKQANMSKSSLFRLFKNELGITPIEYIIRTRIQQAKSLLRKTKSVKETCFSVGFNDVNYFVRLFKNRVGITPGAYIICG